DPNFVSSRLTGNEGNPATVRRNLSTPVRIGNIQERIRFLFSRQGKNHDFGDPQSGSRTPLIDQVSSVRRKGLRALIIRRGMDGLLLSSPVGWFQVQIKRTCAGREKGKL